MDIVVLSPISLIDPSKIADIGALFTPDPALGLWSKWRWSLGPSSFSIIGQTHTLATKAAIDHLDSLGTDALGPWDALICSSTAGSSVVQQLMDSRLEQLQSRFGFKISDPRRCCPQLPVILSQLMYLVCGHPCQNARSHASRFAPRCCCGFMDRASFSTSLTRGLSIRC